MDTFTFVVSILITLFVISDVAAAYLLLTTAAKSAYSLVALNERAFVATVQATSGTLLGILGANRIFDWHMHEVPVLLILSAAILLQAMPSLVWLWLFFRNKFGSR